MNIDPSNPATIAALSVSVLPKFNEFILGIGFNHSLLEQKQIDASQIEELRDLINTLGIPDFPVILCDIPNMRGCVFLDGEIPWPLMFLDTISADTIALLRESYIHEAAHLASNGSDHDFAFAVVHNTFRFMAGLASSEEEYDYRACDWDGLSFAEAKSMSEQFAHIIMHANMSAVENISSLNPTIPIFIRRYQSPDDTSQIMTAFTDHVKMLSSQRASL